MLLLLNPRRTRTNMKLLQLVWIFLLTLCGQSDSLFKLGSDNGAAPRPFVTLHRSKNGVVLKCEVLDSYPEPLVQWWDSDGKVLSAHKPQVKSEKGKPYNVMLDVTVKKSGDYRCVATQKEINHHVFTETYVPGPDGSWIKLLIGIVVGVVLTVFIGVSAWCFCKKRAAG